MSLVGGKKSEDRVSSAGADFLRKRRKQWVPEEWKKVMALTLKSKTINLQQLVKDREEKRLIDYLSRVGNSIRDIISSIDASTGKTKKFITTRG